MYIYDVYVHMYVYMYGLRSKWLPIRSESERKRGNWKLESQRLWGCRAQTITNIHVEVHLRHPIP